MGVGSINPKSSSALLRGVVNLKSSKDNIGTNFASKVRYSCKVMIYYLELINFVLKTNSHCETINKLHYVR
jgi:hypothetical protein